ncbi:SAM-dependent methyltransferase [Halomonas denitrificans]|uniref:tRNA (guanine(46)-N(7))-methyltransferase TrmB n=1 Tax=Halomonas TaxID=2745 RepID=UPI001A8FF222|nr:MULTISPECIES: SAM-dependent methyltransferase [Halomonas]MED5296192.1 SAM-dependent methyltransferase [Pseudomonadota bacterium]MBN8411977.1 SAM-dependent methyltransferase [Halomonas litopenaei]MBY5926376.1 SAM-dependent methyltransferase [Halomonas sp. DP4Y7-2]MBY5970008.1 SAM-dependent methyltransferase [Halomonas denitrificans]MBY5985635.1 SAM-dependent methyltransferase [Halomonas sp. DP5Y7-2]
MSDVPRIVTSAQTGPHEDLLRRVTRGLSHVWRKPLAQHTRDAFDDAEAWRRSQGERGLILDACCGVGLSTRRLAEQFPEHSVIGVDRSADRLSRDHGPLPDNALLVRADLVDFWRLALATGWQPERHYLLYPNPYPKSVQLKHRWHGHPVFPAIVGLGGRLEVRSNWRVYVEEFAAAVALATGVSAPVEAHDPGAAPMTHFERKYHEHHQPLWRLVATLDHRPQLMPTP